VFTPVAPWEPGEYGLVAQSFLEDPQGNQIGRAFEASADTPDDPQSVGVDTASRLAFTIRN
jgi:hypothetical protein